MTMGRDPVFMVNFGQPGLVISRFIPALFMTISECTLFASMPVACDPCLLLWSSVLQISA